MYQIDSTGSASSLPTPAAAGTPGYFTGGNPATGTPATILDGDWFNAVMLELINVVQAGGLTPSKTATNQVLLAIQSMIAAGNSRPSFSANLGGTNQTLASSVFSKVLLSAEEFDTASDFDPVTNHRFTPTVAGKYLLTGAIDINAGAAGNGVMCAIYKNGVIHRQGATSRLENTFHVGSNVAAVVDANGTTDYFELWAYQDNAASQPINGNTAATFFSGMRIGS